MSTPGPWKVQPGRSPGILEVVGASFTVTIVTQAIGLTFDDFCLRTADAHLMAASPLLLAAAKKALAECVDLIGTEAGNDLIHAIAMAGGSQR